MENKDASDVVNNVTNLTTTSVPSAVESRENYRYTKIDCLDEDTPIPGQTYVLLSFISPEGIMNCNIRGIKVRGVYGDIDRANKAAEKLSKIDKNHHIFVGEMGKWMPWDPTEKQVEEEKFQDEKLDAIMKRTHEAELKTGDLNELVGRHKEKMEVKELEHENRVKQSVKQAAVEYKKSIEEQRKAAEQQPTDDSAAPANPPPKTTTDYNSAKSSRDKEAIKERLRKKIEENRQKQASQPAKSVPSAADIKARTEHLQKESERLATKEFDVETLKTEKAKLDATLQKMKEAYNAPSA